MVEVKKCRSKKHQIGGCGDPRCPEGLSIQTAVEEAVKNHDLSSFLNAREMQDAQPTFLSIRHGIINMVLSGDGKEIMFKYPAKRLAAIEAVKSIDKTDLRSFDDPREMENYLNNLYRPYGYVRLHPVEDTESGHDLKLLYVGNMQVDADVRGLGIGRHMRAMILRFADEHNYVVTGTPTESGDETLERTGDNEEEFKAHALAHKARLVKFYLDSGYEYNYAYRPYDKKSYWTGEPHPVDEEWEKKLNSAAAEFLRESGFYVRWPNGEIPANWMATKSA